MMNRPITSINNRIGSVSINTIFINESIFIFQKDVFGIKNEYRFIYKKKYKTTCLFI